MAVACPHCGKQIVLGSLHAGAKVSSAFRIVLIPAGAVLLLAAAAGLFIFHQHSVRAAELQARREAEAKAAQAQAEAKAKDPIAQAGWSVSSVRLEKTPGSTVVHAVGTLVNETDRRRFGVKVELDLFGADQAKIGTATDYQQVVEPRGKWDFSALVLDEKAVAAKLATVLDSP